MRSLLRPKRMERSASRRRRCPWRQQRFSRVALWEWPRLGFEHARSSPYAVEISTAGFCKDREGRLPYEGMPSIEYQTFVVVLRCAAQERVGARAQQKEEWCTSAAERRVVSVVNSLLALARFNRFQDARYS